MSSCRACFLLLGALPAFSATALAQNQNQNKPQTQNQTPAPKPAVVQPKTNTASQQLHYATQGPAENNHVFTNTPKPANPVQGNTAPKPSPLGQPVYSTPGNPGYKLQQPALHTNPVPPPPTIARSTPATTTPTVTRSTTTATVPPKKP
jgi:hypothetical protein